MEGSKIGEAFQEISMNLLSMRTNLKAVIFDEDFGAFRHICSERIRNTMFLFSESVHKNHEAASSSIIKLADHLKNSGQLKRESDAPFMTSLQQCTPRL